MALQNWTKLKVEYSHDKKDLRKKAEVRAAAILTNAYVSSDEVDVSGFGKVALFFSVTKGSLTSFSYKAQQSFDAGSTWYDIGIDSASGDAVTEGIAEYTRTLGGNEAWYKVIDSAGERLRVQVKGTGTLTGSSCTVTIVGIY